MIGAMMVIAAFVGGTFYGWWLAKHQPTEEAHTQEAEERPNDMARQWFNIMNYDGTERGQIGADDADYDS